MPCNYNVHLHIKQLLTLNRLLYRSTI